MLTKLPKNVPSVFLIFEMSPQICLGSELVDAATEKIQQQ